MKQASLAACLSILVIAGCRNHHSTTPIVLPPTVQESPVQFEGIFVGWSKTYTVNLSDGRKLEVKAAQTSYKYLYPPNGVEFSSTVTQADGKWVDFDCAAIAEKIIQPELVTELSHWCGIILPSGLAYWSANNPPPQFTDGDGNVWQLKTKGAR